MTEVDPEQVVVEAMNTLSHRVLGQHDTAYAVANEAGPLLFPVWETADQAGAAYRLWACISDLQDDPRGPGSEELCQLVAERAATDWLSSVRAAEAQADYFDSGNLAQVLRGARSYLPRDRSWR